MELLCNMKNPNSFLKFHSTPRSVLRNVYFTICWQLHVIFLHPSCRGRHSSCGNDCKCHKIIRFILLNIDYVTFFINKLLLLVITEKRLLFSECADKTDRWEVSVRSLKRCTPPKLINKSLLLVITEKRLLFSGCADKTDRWEVSVRSLKRCTLPKLRHVMSSTNSMCHLYLTLRWLMSYIYIYGAPILDVSRSHTTTQHSR